MMNTETKTATSNSKLFFVGTGVSYIVYAALAIGLEAGLLENAGSAYYRGFLAGPVFLVDAGLILYISRLESYYAPAIRWIFRSALSASIIGLALSIVDLALEGICDSYCDSSNVHAIKVVILCLYIITLIHTVATMIIDTVAGKNSSATQTILTH